MPEIEMFTDLPGAARNPRDFKPFVEAARANPDMWIKVPFEDPKGGIASNLKRINQDLEAHTRKGFTYIRVAR